MKNYSGIKNLNKTFVKNKSINNKSAQNKVPNIEHKMISSAKNNSVNKKTNYIRSVDKKSNICKSDEIHSLSCPYFKKCGGCQYIDMPYEEQLQRKMDTIRLLLSDVIKSTNVKPEKIVKADNPDFYRNKVHAVFDRDVYGNIIRGIYKEDSHSVVNVSNCRLEDKTADKITERIKELLPSFKLKVYDEDTGYGFLRHTLVRTANRDGKKEVMVILVTSEVKFPSKNNFIKVLTKEFTEIVSIIQNINDKRTSMVLGERNICIWGKSFIVDDSLGLSFRISPSSFYQINPEQTLKLYTLALEMAALKGDETVLDAYCGTGTIGMFMAVHCRQVIGVEMNSAAVKDAISNSKQNSLKNIFFVNADATDYMVKLMHASANIKISCNNEFLDNNEIEDDISKIDIPQIDVLCMDPPRSGSTPEFIKAAADLKIGRIVYVSCNPETLNRDLKLFIKFGYNVKRIVPVDMFPHTKHVETVCLLSKLHEAKHHVNVKLDMDELDLTSAESKATYEEIKKYVAEHNDGMKVSNLYIAQVKRKCGIELAENYNLPKSENSRQPKCPKEKEDAIVEALNKFQMI